MLEAVPYQVHTVLTDNGIQFAEQPRNRNTSYSRPMRFDMICEANGIEHRLTKPNHPWTNGQVERMNRTIKDATIKRFHSDSHDLLRTHLADFMAAYNFARRLKTIGGLTPYEYICKIWTSQQDRFILDPIQKMPGLNTYGEKGPARLARRSGYLDRDWVDEGQKTVRGTVFPRRARRGGRTAHPQAQEGQVLPGVSGTKADGGDRARERHWSERAGAG